jgi:hypothetical protein
MENLKLLAVQPFLKETLYTSGKLYFIEKGGKWQNITVAEAEEWQRNACVQN